VLLAVLATLLAGVAYGVLTNNTIADRRVQLGALQTQVAAANAQAAATKPYRDFAALAQARAQTVRQLAATRFDWQRALTQLAKVLPDNVWLSSLLGTVAPGVSVDGGGAGTTSAVRTLLPNPAIELTGCTTDQDSVVRFVSRLRLMDGVLRVSLVDSAKGAASAVGGGGAPAAGGGGDCRHGDAHFPQFDLVIFFDALPSAPAPPGGGVGGAGAPAGPVGTATPAAATTPAPAVPSAPAAVPAANGSSDR
jgi:Tfp pilus assembly protein PilN